jgi:CheY-like chemotaxis protein
MTSNEITVLIVEDLKIAQLAALSLFKKFNCKVHIAGSASKAFEQIFTRHFDIIFIDIQLPDIDGFEIAQTLRIIQRRTRIPLIAVTANSSPNLAAKSNTFGFDDYMLKPLTVEAIRHILYKHLNKLNLDNLNAA